MSTVHQVKCDKCSRKAPLNWNGEHWRVPEGWVQIYDDVLAVTIDEHLCPACRPKRRKKKGGKDE